MDLEVIDSLQSSAKYGGANLKLPANPIADLYDDSEGSVDPVYLAKVRVLNRALQEIGMGKYQVSLPPLQ